MVCIGPMLIKAIVCLFVQCYLPQAGAAFSLGVFEKTRID